MCPSSLVSFLPVDEKIPRRTYLFHYRPFKDLEARASLISSKAVNMPLPQAVSTSESKGRLSELHESETDNKAHILESQHKELQERVTEYQRLIWERQERFTRERQERRIRKAGKCYRG
ncbi:hypothetical protein M422DRAFT_785089 [Sphaerobolus stellatus SS14]|uniref:Uncharacterized protein n=1 Tax=Sphaerobolus stellatus (strain SS14) TaxID=990650 RepID=A0A0C9UCN5_SPHS4|nr:hypothetical protein M422DRAFT_785089 [Sphaerobolus stellatus SS14]